MIAGLKPYGEYTDSGLPWLGQVPAHWDLRPAFGAFVPNRERNFGMKEKTVLSLSYGRIVIKPADKLHGLVPESFETYQIVNPGDIVIRTTDLQNDHTSLRIGMVRDRGIITSAYLALHVLPGVNPEFGFQILNVWDMSKAIYGYGSGLRQGLGFSHFKRMPVALPPAPEQAAIVRFLDWATSRLERAIRAKRKVIALLIEQKQAIIQRAVTRGLDPNVPVKPSGVSWIADIPQHWSLMPIKRACSLVRDGTHLPPVRTLTGFPLLSVRNLIAGRLVRRPDDSFISKSDFDQLNRSFVVRPSDVLMAIVGATLGKIAIVEDMALSKFSAVLQSFGRAPNSWRTSSLPPSSEARDCSSTYGSRWRSLHSLESISGSLPTFLYRCLQLSQSNDPFASIWLVSFRRLMPALIASNARSNSSASTASASSQTW